jgi:hypothetical protein
MQLQEYDLKIIHIKGTDNFFADTLSRNPILLSQESRYLVMKPRELLVLKVDLGIDRTLMKELGNLSERQLGDPTLKKSWKNWRVTQLNQRVDTWLEIISCTAKTTGHTPTGGRCSLAS